MNQQPIDSIIPNRQEPDNKYEKYDVYEEQFIEKGGGGKKTKRRNPKGKTSKAARAEARHNATEARTESSQDEIEKVLKGFPEFKNAEEENKFIDRYNEWVKNCLETNTININVELDTTFEFFRSGSHAGGQNANKVNSAARYTHRYTNIAVRNDETRDQMKNRERALKLLTEELTQHIANWKIYLAGKGKKIEDIDRDLLLNLMISQPLF